MSFGAAFSLPQRTDGYSEVLENGVLWLYEEFIPIKLAHNCQLLSNKNALNKAFWKIPFKTVIV